MRALYEFPEEVRDEIVRIHLSGMTGRPGEVSKLGSGEFGTTYLLTPHQSTHRLVAKMPAIHKFGTPQEAVRGLEGLLYELDRAHQFYRNPWVNRFFDVQIVHGWPFLWSRWRMGTLAVLIDDPANWDLSDKLVTLALIARALRTCGERGLIAHQDLKPENILFDDVRRTHQVPHDSGIHFHVFLADFGLANACLEIGRNSGPRPYMAPEQYSSEFIHGAKIDVFALCVLAHECLTDGVHPIGERTRDVWPAPIEGMAKQWKKQARWKKWACSTKTLDALDGADPELRELILAGLSPDSSLRPSVARMEEEFGASLERLYPDRADRVRHQVGSLESDLGTPDEPWPHMLGPIWMSGFKN
jgi:serine/threonine protein kinase